jgi:ribosomal protein L40E
VITRGQLVVQAEKDWIFDALLESCKKLKAKVENADRLNYQIDGKSATTMTRFGQKFHIRLLDAPSATRVEVYDFFPVAPDKRFIEYVFKEFSKLVPVTSGFTVDTVKQIESIQSKASVDVKSPAAKGDRPPLSQLIVDSNLVKKFEYEAKVRDYDGDIPFGDIDKMMIFPIEIGNKIELYKQDVPVISISIKSIKMINTTSRTKGMLKKQEDLMLEITFDDGSQIRTIKLDVSDKQVNEILSKINNLRDLENRYWTVINFTYVDDGRDVPITLFPTSPFLAAGEKILWHVAKTGGVFSKYMEWIQVLTNFRMLEYDFQTHRSTVIALPSIDDIIIANRRTESETTHTGDYKYGVSSTKSRTIGNIVFMSEGKPMITLNGIFDPDAVVEIARSAKQQAMNTMIKTPVSAETNATKSAVSEVNAKEIACTSCDSLNPPDSRFCRQCGSKLDSLCPGCSAPNPAGSAFCNQCGSALK